MTSTPAWAIVGNIGGLRGESTGPGTKHFSHGTKVYIGSRSRGDVDSVPVVGHHRGGGRLVGLWMQSKHIVNLRVKLVCDRSILAKLKSWIGPWNSCESADEFKDQILKSRRE